MLVVVAELHALAAHRDPAVAESPRGFDVRVSRHLIVLNRTNRHIKFAPVEPGRRAIFPDLLDDPAFVKDFGASVGICHASLDAVMPRTGNR